MILRSLHLHNFCQHSDRQFDIAPGLVGVIGRNGGGKTNMSGPGLMFALTGEADDESGRRLPRTELLRRGHESGFAQLVLDTSDGREMVVRWNMPNGTQSLSFDGHDPVRKVTDIAKELEAVYGMPLKLVQSSCFIRQRGFGDFVHMLPTRRADELKSLFGDLDTDKAMAEIQAEISEVGAAADYTLPLADARRALADAERTEADAAAVRDASARQCESLLPGYEAALGRLQLPVLGDDPGAALSAARTKVLRIGEAIASHESLRPQLPAAPRQPQADGARLKKLLEQYTSEYAHHGELEASMAAAEAQLAPLAPLDLAAESKSVADARAWLENAARPARQAAADIAAQAAKDLAFATGGAECPVSRSRCPVLPGPERVAELKAASARCAEALRLASDTLRSETAKADAAEKALADKRMAEARKEEARRRVSATCASLSNDIQKAEAWMAGAYAQVAAFDAAAYDEAVEAAAAHAKLAAAVAVHDARSLELSRSLSAAQSALEDAGRAREGLTRGEHAAARSVVDAHRLAGQAVDAAAKALSDARARRAAMEERLSMLERDAALARANGLVRAGMDTLRMFFHRSNGPAYVIRSNLANYNIAMAKHLDELGFGLRAWVDEDFELRFDKPEMGVFGMAGSRLSGAEGVAVALAERLARRDVTACRVPLLVLDEPAAAMDRENVEALARMFVRLREKVRGQMTVLVPSHASALEPSFERVINI